MAQPDIIYKVILGSCEFFIINRRLARLAACLARLIDKGEVTVPRPCRIVAPPGWF
jgi:hypothetical protein